MKSESNYGQVKLIEDVHNKGLCVCCGACVSQCPYFEYFDGKVVKIDNCQSDKGKCYKICPQIYFQNYNNSLDKNIDKPIGDYIKVIVAKSLDKEVKEKSQYGGSVTSLLIYALEKKIINAAQLTDCGNKTAPCGVIAKKKSDIINCAGSRYSASAGLKALNIAISDGLNKICVVGLPCQMIALDQMKKFEKDETKIDNYINLKIGLFCTWALDYRLLSNFLINKDINNIKKCDIPPPPANLFKLSDGEKWHEFSLDDIRPFIQKGCSNCPDLTAEKSDISVGMLEQDLKSNIIIIRTQKGKDLIDRAVNDKIIDVDDISNETLEQLKKASFNKKDRVGELQN